MASRTLELWALAERLERFEKQNRRLKWAGVAVLLFVFAALLMGQAWPPSETIEARAFIVRDANGVERARLGATETLPLGTGPALIIYSEDGKVRASLGASAVAPGLALYGADGKDQVGLYALRGGPVLWMWGKDGEVMQVSLMAEEGGYLELYDADGRSLFSTPW